VLAAVRNDDSGEALNRLCRRYWKPIYIYSRRDGLAPADAEDATQDFFSYLLERSWLKESGEERGSFRGFLLALLRHFLANRRRQASAQKRGGNLFPNRADLSELETLATDEADPALAYERAWAGCVTQAALEALSREQTQAGNAARFAALQPFLARAPSSADYERITVELGVPSNRVAVYLHRLTRRYGELIRAEVADTVADPLEVGPELRRLVAVLSHAG